MGYYVAGFYFRKSSGIISYRAYVDGVQVPLDFSTSSRYAGHIGGGYYSNVTVIIDEWYGSYNINTARMGIMHSSASIARKWSYNYGKELTINIEIDDTSVNYYDVIFEMEQFPEVFVHVRQNDAYRLRAYYEEGEGSLSLGSHHDGDWHHFTFRPKYGSTVTLKPELSGGLFGRDVYAYVPFEVIPGTLRIFFYDDENSTVPYLSSPLYEDTEYSLIINRSNYYIEIIGERYPLNRILFSSDIATNAYFSLYYNDQGKNFAMYSDNISTGNFYEVYVYSNPHVDVHITGPSNGTIHLNTYKILAYSSESEEPDVEENQEYGDAFIFPITTWYNHIVITNSDAHRVTINIKKSKSIESAGILLNGSFRNLTQSINPFYVYIGSDIKFDSIVLAENFDVPYVLKFYESSDYNPDEITLIQRYITGLILPQYSVNENTLYAEISACMEPFTWYETDEEDMEYIQAGNLFTENFSADMWNAYREKLKLVCSLYGINYSYIPVESGDIFDGMGVPGYPRADFSDVVDILQLLPNSQMTIGHKGTGATVFASYFQDHADTDWRHGNSIKKSLNDVIHFYNGELEEETK